MHSHSSSESIHFKPLTLTSSDDDDDDDDGDDDDDKDDDDVEILLPPNAEIITAKPKPHSFVVRMSSDVIIFFDCVSNRCYYYC